MERLLAANESKGGGISYIQMSKSKKENRKLQAAQM